MDRLIPCLFTACALVAGCADSTDPGRGQRTSREQTPPPAEEPSDSPLVLWEYPSLPYSAQHMEYLRLLQSELGVSTAVMELPAGKKDATFRAEVNRHNEQARQRIETQHGQGVLGRIRQKAMDNWEAKVKTAREKVAEPSNPPPGK